MRAASERKAWREVRSEWGMPEWYVEMDALGNPGVGVLRSVHAAGAAWKRYGGGGPPAPGGAKRYSSAVSFPSPLVSIVLREIGAFASSSASMMPS